MNNTMHKMIFRSLICLIAIFMCAAAPPNNGAHKTELKEKLLSCSVRVNHRMHHASCGVIVGAHKGKDFTEITVISTGHMCDRVAPELEIFYLDGKRLDKPIFVKGHILFLVENGFDKGTDFCVIRATVNTKKTVAHIPLAPYAHKIKKNEKVLSVGCDMGIEPKLFYDMQMEGYRHKRGDLFLRGESQVGRSGGGLFTLDGSMVVGVCWGGYTDKPKAMFTTHRTIIKLMDLCGIER